MKNRWATVRSGHNKKYTPPPARVDLENPIWCYLLGVHLGDGCDSRRIDIAVGWQEAGWSLNLVKLLRAVGLRPKRNTGRKVIRVRASSQPVMAELNRWKHGGRLGLWAFPERVPHLLDFLAGLVDSDGTVTASSGAVTIYQRDNGNIERLHELLTLHRITGVLAKYPRQANAINGRYVAPRVQVQLGIRGTIRDALALHYQNPVRIRAWRDYRRKYKCAASTVQPP